MDRKTRYPKKQMCFLKPAELLALLRAAKARGMREHGMILLAYSHGLRASEVCNMKLSDVDIRAQAVKISRLKGSLDSIQTMHVHRGEPLLDEVKTLKTYLAERVEDGSGFLFLSQKGGAMSRQHFHTLFQVLAEEAGIPEEKRHPHVLKHSIASHLIGENVNLAVVQQKLGHRSISSTMVYIGVSGEQVAEECDGALLRAFGR
jgi:type 1 fimbriae regulatory protein FimB